MKRIIPVILLLVSSVIFGTAGLFACGKEEPGNKCDREHTISVASVPQNSDKPVMGYCGNTITTIITEGKEYTFW